MSHKTNVLIPKKARDCTKNKEIENSGGIKARPRSLRNLSSLRPGCGLKSILKNSLAHFSHFSGNS